MIRPSWLLVILCILSFQIAAKQTPGSSSIRVEFRLAEASKSDGLIEATVKDSGLRIYLHKTVLISNKDVSVAKVVISDARIADLLRASGVKVEEERKYDVEITFTNEAAQRIEKATQKHLNKHIAIIIDGVVVSAPFLAHKLSTGASISMLTQEQAQKIAISLNQK
jgi:preprotein translocase subunit SecD